MSSKFLCRFMAVKLVLLSGWLSFNSFAQESPSSLTAVVEEAVRSSSNLAAVKSRARALAELPSQQAALPDPRLSINLMNLPVDGFSFTQEAMTQFQVGISQALPFPGKLALRAEVAQFEAEAAASQIDETRLSLVRDVKLVWWNLFYLDRALEKLGQNKDLLTQFIRIAETRYEVGQGAQQDVLLAQLALSKLGDTAIRLNQLRENEVIRFNILLARPAESVVEIAAHQDTTLPLLRSRDALKDLALASQPTLRAQQQLTEAAQRRYLLSKKSSNPDFTLGAAYGLRRGDHPSGGSRADFASLMFSMNLPLYANDKQRRSVDQHNAAWMMEKHRLQDHHLQVIGKVMQVRADYQYAVQQVNLFKHEVIPQAQQTVEAMMAGYQVAKVDFQSLVTSQTRLYEYETQYWKAWSVAQQALARLEAAVGVEQIYE